MRRFRRSEPGLAAGLSPGRTITFECPVCKRRHIAGAGDIREGQVFDYECTDNASSEVEKMRDLPKDSNLFSTDGSVKKLMTVNPLSRRSDQYLDAPVQVKKLVGKYTKYTNSRGMRNW